MSEVLLRQLYYDLGSPASYSGIDSLYRAAHKLNPNIRKPEVKRFLESQNVHLRHRRPRKPKGHSQRFNKFVTTAPKLDFSCDSAYFKSSRLPFAVVCRDGFSGKVYAKPQRNLTSATTLKTLRSIIQEQAGGVYPHTVYTDLGNEYRRIRELPIVHKTTFGRSQKAFLAEQTIRVLRAKLNRYATYLGRKVDISDALPLVLKSINNTPNSRTHLTPNESEKVENFGLVFERKFGKYLEEKQRAEQSPKFLPGDFVRVAIPDSANQFLKRSLPGFSAEVFQVKFVRDTLPKTFIVQDSTGRVVDGYFAESHLIRAEPNFKDWRLVDKVFEKRTKPTGQTEYLVSFKHYPSTYKRWLNQAAYDYLKKPFNERV